MGTGMGRTKTIAITAGALAIAAAAWFMWEPNLEAPLEPMTQQDSSGTV